MKYHIFRAGMAYSDIGEAYRCKKLLEEAVMYKENVYFIHDPETMYFKVGVLAQSKVKFLIRPKAYLLSSLIQFAMWVDKKLSVKHDKEGA